MRQPQKAEKTSSGTVKMKDKQRTRPKERKGHEEGEKAVMGEVQFHESDSGFPV